MNQLILIAIGSGIGGVCRYLLSTSVYQFFGKAFPYGTLAVNALGSLLIGFIFIILLDLFNELAEQLRALLIIGFLGGFTTFSTFSLETLQLFENGELLRAVLNIVISIVICLTLAAIGALLARQL